MRLKVRSKLFITVLFIIIITATFIGVGIYYSLRKNLNDGLVGRMLVNSQSEVGSISDLIYAKDFDNVYNYIFNERYARKDMAYMIVLDDRKNLIASTLLAEKADTYIQKNDLGVNEALKFNLITDQNGEQVYNIISRLNYNKGFLITGYFQKNINKTLNDVLLILFLVVISSVFGALIIAYIASFYLFKPLLRLVETSKEVATGNLSVRASVETDDEIGYFAKTFNSMLDAVEKYQKSAIIVEKSKYEYLIEKMPLCIKIFDENRKLIFINKGGREEHGIPDNQDLNTWDWAGTVEKKFLPEVNSCFDRAYQGEGGHVDFMHTKEGSKREWCSSIMTPVKDEDGKVKKVLFVSSDITDLKIAEFKAERNTKMFKTLIDSVPFCVKWYDATGKLISVNKHGKDEHFLTDKTDEEISNTVFKSNVVEEYRSKVEEGMANAKKGLQKTYELRHIAGTAKSDWVENTFVPIKDSDQKVQYILMISREITQEKELEAERQQNLKKSEETKLALFNILDDAKESERVLQQERDRSSAIISSMGESLVVIDKNFKIILMNNKASEVIGIDPNEAIGHDYRQLVLVLNKNFERLDADRPVEKVFVSGEYKSISLEDNLYYESTKNGYRFPVVAVITPLIDKDNSLAIIVFQDITKAKALDEAKSSFISVASHQLRTPLTSIRWYMEMINSGDDNLNIEQKDFVSRAYSNVLKLGQTINLLLAMARIESGRTTQELSEIVFKDLVNEVVKEQEPAINNKKLAVKVNLLSKKLPELKADAVMLRQVVGNILSNAVRYTDKTGQIEIDLSKNDTEIIFSLKDNGIGVPDVDKPRLFEKFFRAKNAISKVPDGSGLGLSLVKSLVELWKGKLSFESPTSWVDEKGVETKKGTKFTFTIPYK